MTRSVASGRVYTGVPHTALSVEKMIERDRSASNWSNSSAQLARPSPMSEASPSIPSEPATNSQYRAEPARYWEFVAGRSEEHTSELQSRPHLVCRLLLEKKKTGSGTPPLRQADLICLRLIPVDAR